MHSLCPWNFYNSFEFKSNIIKEGFLYPISPATINYLQMDKSKQLNLWFGEFINNVYLFEFGL
jgi:hypothetical protein